MPTHPATVEDLAKLAGLPTTPEPGASGTPRVDACQGSDGTVPECEELSILARTLETELIAALAKLALWDERVEVKQKAYEECADQLSAAIARADRAEKERDAKAYNYEARNAALLDLTRQLAEAKARVEEMRKVLVEIHCDGRGREVFPPWTEGGMDGELFQRVQKLIQ